MDNDNKNNDDFSFWMRVTFGIIITVAILSIALGFTIQGPDSLTMAIIGIVILACVCSWGTVYAYFYVFGPPTDTPIQNGRSTVYETTTGTNHGQIEANIPQTDRQTPFAKPRVSETTVPEHWLDE